MKALLAFMLVGLLVLGALMPAAASIGVEVFPISPEMKNFPIKVYVSRETTCSPEAYEMFLGVLNVALQNLNKSIDAFISQYPGRFDALLLLKPTITYNEGEATIIISFRQLGDGPAGFAELPLANGHLVPKPKINYDCEVVTRPTVPPANVVLHEFLHGLGLGHSNFVELYGVRELMSQKGSPNDPVIYPSTLDLYALHLLWFGGYKEKFVPLPSWLKYEMVMPTAVPRLGLEELEKRLSTLEEGVQELNSTIITISGDIKTINRDLEEAKRRIAELEAEKERLEEELARQDALIKEYGDRIRDLEAQASRIPQLEADVKACQAEVGRLWVRLLEESSQLQSRIEALERDLSWANRLLTILLAALMAAIGVSAAALTLSLLKRRQVQPSP